MLKSAYVSLVLLLATLCPAAKPAFRIGPRLTYGIPYSVYEQNDSAFGVTRVIDQQPYVATGLEVEYGPLFMFRFGLELAQVRFFTHGGADIVAFPLGANVTIEPPVNWRLLPYAFVGGHFGTDFVGRTTLGDSLTMVAPMEQSVRAGIGGRFALTPRIDLYTEI